MFLCHISGHSCVKDRAGRLCSGKPLAWSLSSQPGRLILQWQCGALQSECKVLQSECKFLQSECKVLQSECKALQSVIQSIAIGNTKYCNR